MRPLPLAAIHFALLAITCAAAEQKPNIVLIFSDDHAYQAISAYGDPRKLNETPNIDRIGREGVRFDRCLVANPLCGPSRAAVLTGKYTHLNGFYNNSATSRFDGSQVTFPKLLQKAGYQTAIIGKWHLVSDPTGFDYWEILPGQGAYYDPAMIRNGERVKYDGYVTDITTNRSVEWLEKRDKSKPFLLMSQHKAPHRPWQPALRHLDHDKGRKYPEPETLFDNYANRGIAVKEQEMEIGKEMTPNDLKLNGPHFLKPALKAQWNAYYEPRNAAFKEAGLTGRELVSWKYQRYLHDYLGCIASVDESVGKLLDYLDREGLAENTIVVYASDQGFFLGEHGWFDKRWIFEESMKTPMLIRWPGVAKAGAVNKDMVSLLDLPETFLEAAGVEIPAEMQGRSLVPNLKGETPADQRKSFYFHYYEYDEHNVRPHYGVVTDRYKLVHFYGPEVDYWELYDREKDPHELRSVYGHTEYADTQKELHAELTRLRTELKVPPESEIPAKAHGGRFVKKAAE